MSNERRLVIVRQVAEPFEDAELVAIHKAIRNASRIAWIYECSRRCLKLARGGKVPLDVALDTVSRYRRRIRELRPFALSFRAIVVGSPANVDPLQAA